MELTHIFDSKAPVQGYIYTVVLKMVPFDLVVDNQRWSYSTDPDNSPIRRVRDRLRYIENTKSGTIEPKM
jgi:hypothetical protein